MHGRVMVMSMKLTGYLERIGLAGPISADPAGLTLVQAAQRRSIAFENLDVRLGRGIEIGHEAVFAKLVGERRGGYCFEHNRLLADMLGEMGLASRPLLARPMLGPMLANPAEPMPRTHCLLLLEIGEAPWIADGGFGGAFCPPLPLLEGVVTTSEDGASHRLRRLGEAGVLPGEWLLERRAPGEAEWAAQFAFDLAEVAPSDLAMGNHWSCTHPAARFVNEQVVTLCLPDGFASMVDRRFSLHRAGMAAERREIGSAAEYGAVLREVFGLALPEEEVARLPLFTG